MVSLYKGSWGPGSKQEIALMNLVPRSRTGKCQHCNNKFKMMMLGLNEGCLVMLENFLVEMVFYILIKFGT
jgi:hypothetical protein